MLLVMFPRCCSKYVCFNNFRKNQRNETEIFSTTCNSLKRMAIYVEARVKVTNINKPKSSAKNKTEIT